MHDKLTLDKSRLTLPWLRKIYTHIRYFVHYGYFGKNAYFISVCKDLAVFCDHYRHHLFSFPPENLSLEDFSRSEVSNTSVLINGIDIQRLSHDGFKKSDDINVFLSFGGHAYRKSIPTIIDAATILKKKGYIFKLLITDSKDTTSFVREKYK